MKSRLLRAKDYRTIDVKPMLTPFVPDGEALEREFARIINPYIRWEEGETVSAGDQVTCRLESECPRFHRDKLRFVAGSGMFHRELESLSIGMKMGETRKIQLTEGAVSLTVTGVVNRIVPEATDDMVEKLGIENVRTIEEYRGYLRNAQKEEAFWAALYEPQNRLMEEVLRESEFVLDKEDWLAVVEREIMRCRVLCRHEGMILEEMTPEQFSGRIPVKSYHELLAMVQRTSWDELCKYLLGRQYAKEDGFLPTDYETFLADYAKDWHTTVEKAREINTPENHVFRSYVHHAHSVHAQYLKEQYFMED